MKNNSLPYLSTVFATLLLLLASSLVLSEELNDADALKDLKVGKVVWDINVDNPTKLLLYLKVIQQTYDSLVKQHVTPDMVFAFRGEAVKLITVEHNHDHTALEQHNEKMDTVMLLMELQKQPGVKMEVCGVAMALFDIKKESILSGIKPVGNTFISLIGYHAQGYTAIPIY
jgi:intracellular sulfur oxidation DsrE/DsrF family protein